MNPNLIHPAPFVEPTPKRILIVEDDRRIAAALEVRFKSVGLLSVVAHDAVAGRVLAVRHQPDVIVLDISLPGGNGLKLAEQFRRLPETREAPIIFITASSNFDFRAQATRLKAAGYLQKPYDPEELQALVEHALARRELNRDDRLWANILPEPRHGAPNKILIIEDDEKIALGLQLRLKSAGYETAAVGDALAGMKAAIHFKPDLVLLDISMPAGNGFSLAKQIRTNLSCRPPIIFLTASSRPDFRDRAKELGAAGFFEKPYEAKVLLAAIRKALAHHP